MNIGPTSGSPLRVGPGPTSEASKTRETVRRDAVEAAPAQLNGDHVQLSPESRDLLASLEAGHVPTGEITASRLRDVLERIQGGYYDRPEILGQVIDRMATDLGRDHG